MVSLSRLFHKTDEREKPATAATAPAEPACAPTAKATVAPVELPQEFLDKFPGGMLRYKAEEAGAIDRVSSGLVRLFGCSNAEQFRALTGNTFKGIVHPDDWEWVSASVSEQIGRSDSDYVRYRIIRADGEVRWVDDWGHLVEDAAGTRWFYATIMDATERVREKEELRRANERLEILTALSNDVLFDIECGTGKAHVYGDFEGRFGRAPQQEDFVVNRRCQKPCELAITSHDLTPLMTQIGENSLVDFETSAPGADGEPVWYRYQSVVLYDEEGGPVRHVGRLLDTSEAAMRESQFRRKAERDSLTGLYNRAAALDRIETALRTENRPCTLIVVDVDDFKAVNDTYGHPEGDYVLKKLAIFLSQVMRKEDIVARIGGRRVPHFCPGLGDRSCRRARARAFGSRALRRPAGHRRGRRPDLSRGAHHQRGGGLLLDAADALRGALRGGRQHAVPGERSGEGPVPVNGHRLASFYPAFCSRGPSQRTMRRVPAVAKRRSSSSTERGKWQRSRSHWSKNRRSTIDCRNKRSGS